MARVGCLERDRHGAREEHDVDDPFERHVAVVGPFVVAPAQVHPQPIRRDVRSSVVEHLDVQPRLLAELVQRQVRVLDVPAHGEVRAVDLQDDSGLCNRLVLVAHRIRDREKVSFLARIVVVPEEEPDHAGGGRAHERFLGLHLGRGRFQVVDVVLRALSVAHADRRIARRGFPARAARVAEHALGEVRKFDEVLVDEGVARTAESAEAVLDVGGVARLRHLAVVDDVHARSGLLLHDFLHRGADARAERSEIDRHALLLRIHRAHQVLRPRQAAGVRGEETFGAALHDKVGCRMTLPIPARASTRRCAFAASASGRMRSMSTR